MATVTIYRLQGADGDGPFRSIAFMRKFPELYQRMLDHAGDLPSPTDIGEPFQDFCVSEIPFCYRFGVTDRNLLDDWFPMMDEILATGLFKLVTIEVDQKKTIPGIWQIAFVD